MKPVWISASIALGATLSIIACDEKKDAGPTTPPAATSAATPASATATAAVTPSATNSVAATTGDDDVPTEEDFEDEGADITATNMETELASIEKELK
jgi:hypothetical protein